MQVSVEQSGALERKMTVEVPEERIAGQVNDRLQGLGRTAKVNGFRPGKVPLKVIERRFGAKVREEVLGEIIRSTFAEAMTQEDLRPVGEPTIEPLQMKPGSGMRYTATFEVYPTVELALVEALSIERPRCEIVDADIDKMVETLREQHKTWAPVDRAAQNGDQVTVDFEGKIDAEVFDGGVASDFEIVLGTGQMIDGFEAGLLHKTLGQEVALNLKFPAAYRVEKLAGKEVKFAIKLKRIADATLPDLDDDFFKKFGVDKGGETAFRADVRGNMERERERALQRRFNSGVLNSMSEANELALPRTLVEAEISRMQRQAIQSMLQRGAKPDELDPSFIAETFDEPAQKRVKLGLLMAEMIKKAGITADPAKVRGTVESMASSYEDSAAVVKWYYDDPQRLHEIEAMCLEDEAVTWIAERAQVNEVFISFDDLMNPGQTAHTIKA